MYYKTGKCDCKPISEEYRDIENPDDLYCRLKRCWSRMTCAPRFRDKWSEENITLGQCSITAFLAQDIFGGEVYGITTPNGAIHCFNVVGDSAFDLTSEQFGDTKLDYSTGVEQSRDDAHHFGNGEKQDRYELLKRELKKELIGRINSRMRIETERLIITEFTLEMAQAVHENSLDEDNRRFVPDEVFETVDEARETIDFLMSQYETEDGPLVYPVITKNGDNIGYVQLVPVEEGWEIGYHIAKSHTGQGYASEAVMAFLLYIAERKSLDAIWGICLKENVASVKVMEKCGFENVYVGEGNYQGEMCEIVKNIWKVK